MKNKKNTNINENKKKEKIKKEYPKLDSIKKKVGELAYKFKKNFMTNDTRTVLIVLILLGLFIGINLWVKSLNLAQLDVTNDKLYSLTDTSKNALNNLNKDIKIYVWGYEVESTLVDLLKQYNGHNKKIQYEIVTRDEDKKLVEKYAFEDDIPMVIVTDDAKNKTKTEYLTYSDFQTYDANFNLVDITEQKITNAILQVNSTEIPKICFIEGKEIDSTLLMFKQYLTELGLYETQDLSTAKDFNIPKECSMLVIPSLESDLSSKITKKIISYINNGGNIMILNDVPSEEAKKLPNLQSILDLYGAKFERNCIVETGDFKIADTNLFMQGNISKYHDITKTMDSYPVLYAPGSITFDQESVAKLKVSYEAFLYSSDESKAVNLDTEKTDNSGMYSIGVAATKIVSDGVISKAIFLSTQTSFSDLAATSGDYPLFFYNEEIIMNGVAYLTDKGDYYSISKLDSSAVALNIVTTETESDIIKGIITFIPVVIAVTGVVVCRKRNRKN